MIPAKVNLKIYQGSTLRETFRWESSAKVYIPITNITKAAPVEITAVAHGIPEGWRTKVANVIGMKEINSGDNYYKVTNTTTDTITINNINSLGFSDYTSGGVLEYNDPVNLTGYTARMQIRPKVSSETVLAEFTTENGKIILDNVYKTITILISATDTETYSFNAGVYSLELIKNDIVTSLAYGNISLIKEITR